MHHGHRDLHLFSLLLTVIIWSFVALIGWCASRKSDADRELGRVDPSCNEIIPATALIFIALIYFVEVLWSSTQKYLSNIHEVESVMTYIKHVKNAAPRIGYGMTCSHMEVREDKYPVWDARGAVVNEPEINMVPVTTWEGTQSFIYDRFEDTSGDLEWLQPRYAVITLKLTKATYPEFLDAHTKELYKSRKAAFVEKNLWRDRMYSTCDLVQIDGFQDVIIAVRDMKEKPWWLSLKAFYIFSSVGLSWPYRMYLRFRSLETTFRIRKAVKCTSL